MRIRRKYWFVPALAVLGILFALMHFLSKPKVHEETLILDPKEPAPPLPQPALPVEVPPTETSPAPTN